MSGTGAMSRFVIGPADECLDCGYCIRGSRHSRQCPECGAIIAHETVDYRVGYDPPRLLLAISAGLLAVVIVVVVVRVPAMRGAVAFGVCGAAAGTYFGRRRRGGGLALSVHGIHWWGRWKTRRRGALTTWGEIRHAIHKPGEIRIVGRDGVTLTRLAEVTSRQDRETLTLMINLGVVLSERGELHRLFERCRAALHAA